MAGRIKHMQRSHRSYRDTKPFADFEGKAAVKKQLKEYKKTFAERLMSIFCRPVNN